MADPDRQSELTNRMLHRYLELAAEAPVIVGGPAGLPNVHHVMAELAEVVRQYDGDTLASLTQQRDAERAGFRDREQGYRNAILSLTSIADTAAAQSRHAARAVGIRFPGNRA